MKSDIQDMVEQIVKAGIIVSMEWDDSRQTIIYDLNTQMKSHCHLVEIDGKIVAEMRYNEKETVEEYEDLLYTVKRCMHGRDYLNYKWAELLVKEGVLKETTMVTTNYS